MFTSHQVKKPVLAVSIAAALWVAPRLAADVLVTHAGDTLETEGPYRVEGRKIVYRNQQGQLLMIRTSLVDLEASEAATHKQKNPVRPVVEETIAEPVSLHLVELAERNRARRDEPVLVVRQSPALPKGQETAAGEGDAMDEVADSLGAAMDEMGQEMGAALGEAMEAGLEEMAGTMGTMIELAIEFQGDIAGIESGYDLDTAAGWSSALPSLESLANEIESKADSYSDPAKQEVARDMARGLREAVQFARDNPEAAAQKHQRGETLVTIEG